MVNDAPEPKTDASRDQEPKIEFEFNKLMTSIEDKELMP
jgi:hypothetical protein